MKLFHPDFPNLDFHTFIPQLLVQQKKRSEYRYGDYHQPGPSSLSTDSTRNGKCSCFFNPDPLEILLPLLLVGSSYLNIKSYTFSFLPAIIVDMLPFQ